ncbi:T cell receptor beta variable 27 [Camelus dromedarius]|nr:T cell receptor beta variable 27 [Camelus dromedarius]
MGPRLLGWVLLWLLGAGPVEADVTQSPTHRITETRKKLTVTCSQNMNHEAMYWYRQDPGLGLRLIYFSRNVNFTEKGDIPDGYTVSRKEKKDFSLTLESASITQTSLYLCASSVSTARRSQLLSAQEGQPQGQGGASRGRPHPTKRKNFPRHLCPQKLPSDLFFHLPHPSSIGLMDAKVTQIPRYLVKRMGEKVLIDCVQDMGHERMFWYRQDPALGLRLLHYSYDVDIVEKGDMPEGYNVSRKKKERFALTLESASTSQTSVYLCASSISTALHAHILSAQKGQMQGKSDSGLSYAAPVAHVCPLDDG